MRLRPSWIVGAVLAAAPFLCAQATPPFPVESIRIQGNEQFHSDRIAAALALKIGQPVVKADFDRARERLLSTGGFEKVGYEYKPNAAQTGYDVTFEVTETTPLYLYRFEEMPATEATLRDFLHKLEPLYDDRIPAIPQVLNRFSAALAQSLGGGIKIIGDINSDTVGAAGGELMVLFRPMGERSTISDVYFKGNKVVDSDDLTRAMSGAAVGVRYSEPLFRQILDVSLRPLYEERGYIRVAFPTLEVAKSTENEGLVVTVTVEEGPTYQLGDVEFRGVEPRQAAALEKLASLRTNAHRAACPGS